MITLEGQANDGRTEKWQIGGPAVVRMEANGWSKATLRPGITGVGYQYADGEKILRLERVVLADVKELRVYARQEPTHPG
jgi:hypothetical protein